MIKNDPDILKAMNIIPKLKADTAAEIARVEKYLNSLQSFQKVIDPVKKKRKYKKRKMSGKQRDALIILKKAV